MNSQKVLLRDHSSLRVGGEGLFLVVNTRKELIEVLMSVQKNNQRIHILGLGTNTFFGDELGSLLVIKISFKGISYQEGDGYALVTLQAGEVWDDVVQFAVTRNLWGIENLSYIPGTVGAAPVQNIGAYGVELADTLVSLSALDRKTLDVVEITKEGCNFGYRDSLFKQEKDRYIILSVTLKLSIIPKPVLTYKPLDALVGKQNLVLQEVRDLVVATRRAKLPDYNEYPNTGSFFKNPIISKEVAAHLRNKYPEIPLISHEDGYKIPAAWLIEHVADMKGVRTGDVGTWPQQPLVLVNYGNATARDILAFSEEIIQKIEEKTGITLEKEVNFVQ